MTSAGRRSVYLRRRATALAAFAALAIVGVWRILSPDGMERQRRPAPKRTVSSRSAVRREDRRPPALSLAGIPVGRWIRLADAPSSRGEVAAARLRDEVYVVGGFDASGRTTGSVQRYDLRTGRWQTTAPLPQPLNHMNTVGYRGKLYVVGGYASPGDSSTQATTGFWCYDPASGRWRAMPDAPVPRAAAGAAVLGHRLYVVGGRNDTATTLSSVSVYDFNAGRWTLGPPLMHPREHLAAVAAGGSVWALGGRALGIGSFTYVERYTPGRQAWDEMAPLPVARGGFEAVAVGDSILAVGGEDGPETVSEVDRLDLHSGRWTQTPPLAPARHGLGVIADGPLVFAIDGGASSGLTTSHVVQRLRLK